MRAGVPVNPRSDMVRYPRRASTSNDLQQVLEEYGGTFIDLPDEAFEIGDAFPLENEKDTCGVDLDLWTLEEGRVRDTISGVDELNNYRTLCIVAAMTVLGCLGGLTNSCGLYTHSQVEQEINQFREAQNRLLKNPHDVDSLALILDRLRHGSGVTRSNAAAILGELGDQIGASIADKAVPDLIHLLETGNRFDKNAASEALKHFGPHAKSAIPALRRNLRPTDSSVAWNSAEALGAIGEPAREAVPELVNVIMERQKGYLDNGPHTCKFAAQALGKIGPAAKEAVPALETLLDHSNLYFRGHVAIAVISIDPANRKAFSSLEGLLKSSNVEVRREILWSIEDMGTRAAPLKSLIRQALEDRDESVRRAAGRLLSSLGDKGSKN